MSRHSGHQHPPLDGAEAMWWSYLYGVEHHNCLCCLKSYFWWRAHTARRVMGQRR